MRVGTRKSIWMLLLLGVTTLLLLIPSADGTAGLFESGAKIKQGETAVPFTMTDVKGNRINLSEHIGEKAILLDFWSIYCAPCVEQMPAVIELYEKYNEMGLEVFGISLDSRFNAKRLGKFLESYDHDIPYPIIHDAQSEIRRLYGVSSLPTYILVDTDGKIYLFFVGSDEEELELAIKRILK
jgi:peroxiredoxin